MSTFHLATSRQQRSPVRVQQWNASMRAGDDLKLALTVYADDTGALALVPGSRSRLALFYDDTGGHHGWGGWGYGCDYGWGWYSIPPTPVEQVDGYVAGSGWPGQLNFLLDNTVTLGLLGRYRLLLDIDLYDGTFTQVEGVLQVRGCGMTNSLGHVGANVFTLDQSFLDGGDILGGPVNDSGIAVDLDGFPLRPLTFVPVDAVPGLALTMVAAGLVALGVDQGSALPLAALTNVFTSVAAGAGGRLPASVLGGTIVVINATALDLLIYPPVGGTIGSAGVNAPVIVSPNQLVSFVTQGGVQWFAA